MRAKLGSGPRKSTRSKVGSSGANLGGNARCLTPDIRPRQVFLAHEGFVRGTFTWQMDLKSDNCGS